MAVMTPVPQHSRPSVILSLWGWAQSSVSLLTQARTMGFCFWDQAAARPQLLPYVPSLVRVLAHSEGSQSGVAYREAHVAKNWGRLSANSQQGTEALSPTACEELNLGNNHVSELDNGSFLSQAFMWDHLLPDQHLHCSLWRDLQSAQLSHSWISDSRSVW